MEKNQEKSKEEILAERKAKKDAKKQGTKKSEVKVEVVKEEKLQTVVTSPELKKENISQEQTIGSTSDHKEKVQLEELKEAEKSKEQVKAEREAKKLAKQAGKKKDMTKVQTETDQQKSTLDKDVQKPVVNKTNSDLDLAQKMESLHITEGNKTEGCGDDDQTKAKTLTKAERRALQEAQRAAKTKKLEEKVTAKKPSPASAKKPTSESKTKQDSSKTSSPSAISQKSSALHKVRLFKHLYTEKCDLNIKVNSRQHPAMIRLGIQYATDSIVGSNSRCYAFLNAMKTVSLIFCLKINFVSLIFIIFKCS